MQVSILGTGYVGLITGLGLAKAGHQVTLVERRQEIIDKISSGASPFYEPGLDALLSEMLGKKTVAATPDLAAAVLGSDASIMCVGTPSDAQGRIDLSQIRATAGQVGAALAEKKGTHTVVVKSTVVPGTTEEIGSLIERKSGLRLGENLFLGMNPEFLREGCAVQDVLRPDRIVLGTNDGKSRRELHRLYDYSEAPKLDVNIRTAEMIKYANNAFLALCISYSNEIAQICERLENVNAYQVMQGVALDARLSSREGGKPVFSGITSYLVPGCGFGGSCFPKDVRALLDFSSSRGYVPRLLSDTMAINERQADMVVKKLEAGLKNLSGMKIAILGLAFKPDTDDLRESPALRIIDRLLAAGASVRAADPKGVPNAQKIYGGRISCSEDWREVLSGADAAVLVTKWKEFLAIPAKDFRSLMKRPLVIDCRGAYPFAEYSGLLDFHVLGLSG